MGRDVALPQPAVHRYLNLLEPSYMLVRVPAYTRAIDRLLDRHLKAHTGADILANLSHAPRRGSRS